MMQLLEFFICIVKDLETCYNGGDVIFITAQQSNPTRLTGGKQYEEICSRRGRVRQVLS